MQIIFSNQFGCHSKSELILNYPELIDVDISEHNQVLEQGWLMTIKNNKVKWYQSRSTRTKLDSTTYSKLKNSNLLNRPYALETLDKIYDKYCTHRHYKKYFEVNEFSDYDILFGYYEEHKLTAWSKLRRYSKTSIESVQFVWDYSNPTSHLGLHSLRHEIAWAKESGYEYFYMGAGYEKNSIYKSDVNGFEWWTGRDWSTDKDEYIYLCKRDSVISSYHQIHSVLANLQHDRNTL